MNPRLRIGLTGGIASGKSTVTERFVELGVPVIDADVAARNVVAPGTPGLAQVVQRFGPGVLDANGNLDRPALRALITGAGERAAWPFLEFFTGNIRNKNTRMAYLHAVGKFFAWCERHHIGYREANERSILIPAPEVAPLESLFERFQNETFGARAGGGLPAADPTVEGELARRGVDAVQVHDPSFDLRDRLLRDDDDVAVLELHTLEDERDEVVALLELGDAGDGEDRDAGHRPTTRMPA